MPDCAVRAYRARREARVGTRKVVKGSCTWHPGAGDLPRNSRGCRTGRRERCAMAGGGRMDDWKGVYCLEGDGLGNEATVEPVLRLLETVRDPGVRSLRIDVATRGELEFRLRQWAQPEFASHPILYLAFGGEPGEIELAPGEGSFGLRELAALLEGACDGRVIHFGSCATLDLHGNTLNRFMRRTGALALLSYRTSFMSIGFPVLCFRSAPAGRSPESPLHQAPRHPADPPRRWRGCLKETGALWTGERQLALPHRLRQGAGQAGALSCDALDRCGERLLGAISELHRANGSRMSRRCRSGGKVPPWARAQWNPDRTRSAIRYLV